MFVLSPSVATTTARLLDPGRPEQVGIHPVTHDERAGQFSPSRESASSFSSTHRYLPVLLEELDAIVEPTLPQR